MLDVFKPDRNIIDARRITISYCKVSVRFHIGNHVCQASTLTLNEKNQSSSSTKSAVQQDGKCWSRAFQNIQ